MIIPVLKKFLIITIVMLQIAAPLVHAHSGIDNSGQHIHIPGLEMLSVRTDETQFSSIDCCFDPGIVGVSSAIQQKIPAAANPSSSAIVLIQPEYYVQSVLYGSLINFSPHPERPRLKPFSSQHCTRAPPLFSLS